MSSGEPAAAPAGRPPGAFALMRAAFFSPDVIGERIVVGGYLRPMLAAALVLLAISLAIAVATIDLAIADGKARAMDVPGGEAALAFYDSSAARLLMIIVQPFTLVLGLLLIAFLVYLGLLLMGGRAGFGQVLAAAIFTGAISFGVGALLRAGLMLYRGSTLDVSTGLGILLSDRPMGDPLRSLLDILDPFPLWAAVSWGLALARPAALRPAESVGVTLAIYLLMMGAITAMRILFMGT